jgi:LAS superfamily LD-carboxypeptidase LdcB
VRDLAIASFTGESGENGEDLTALLLSDDPSEAARRRSLIEFQTGSLGDGIDRLRSLVAEVEVVSTQRRDAVAAAEAGQIEASQRRVDLEAAKDAQLDLVIAAELRLDARLAEASVLSELDAEKAAEIRRQEETIARRIRQEAARRAAIAAAAERASRPPVATPDEITNVQGFNVHVNIAGKVDQMISAARADGVDLGGWGYRDNIKQIELRQKHCGTSEYDVWEKPASSCRPPTARPGQSMHERGLAIDFTYNGGSITTRSNPGFVWLANNAHRWSFVNLPSEPWHWSTTGQ